MKVNFQIGYAEDGSENLKLVMSIFQMSHVFGYKTRFDRRRCVKITYERGSFLTTMKIASLEANNFGPFSND